jgi:hypothetical protein
LLLQFVDALLPGIAGSDLRLDRFRLPTQVVLIQSFGWCYFLLFDDV